MPAWTISAQWLRISSASRQAAIWSRRILSRWPVITRWRSSACCCCAFCSSACRFAAAVAARRRIIRSTSVRFSSKGRRA
jgi:hypothetical protein